VFALMMNVGWLVVGVLRDRSRTHTINDLASANADLGIQIRDLNTTQAELSQTVQNAIDQKIVLDQITNLLSESRRSLDCVALYVSGQPSKSADCGDVNKRLKDLQAAKPGVFPKPLQSVPVTTTTTTRPPPTTTTTRPRPAPTTTSTIPACRGINLLGLCIGGS
jgi:hypothetical protein